MSASTKRYPQIVRAFSATPWALEESVFTEIRDLIAMRSSGDRFSAEEIQARIGAGPAQRQVVTSGSVAVIPLWGVIFPKASLMSEMSGGTSVEAFSANFAAALADPQVDAIMLDIDSPGGSTDMIPELAAQIRGARGVKPIMALANTMAASAAYWIGSQADEFVVTPSGNVGSIGVYAAHQDVSAKQEQDGVRTTFISAGKYKVEGNAYEPLGDDARAALQERIDAFYGMFVADVAAGRGVSDEAVRAGFGEGRMLTAGAALAEGMVDRVEPFSAALERLARGPAARASRATAQAATSGLTFADEAEALVASSRRLLDRTASLAEVERGHLTVAKREHLSACTGGLHETTAALDALLAETDPNRQSDAVAREAARYELGRSRGGTA